MSENIIQVNIKDEIEQSLLDYGMSIISDRALPSAEDGLKPVNRRILYDMFDKGFMNNKKFVKCAQPVGDCNNIFIEIKGKNNFFLKFPLTVVIVFLIFGFWLLIPVAVIGLFLDVEFFVESKKINTDKVNDILSKISKEVQNIKSKGKGGGK